MNRLTTVLGGALVAQLGLAAALHFTGQRGADFADEQPLVDITSDQIESIKIERGSESVLLKKQEGRWQLPEYGKLPALDSKVTEVLNKIDSARLGFPVASSSGSRLRFQVADDEYQRKITLSDGERSEVFYLGTSPGYRSVHARPASSEDVFSVKLAAFEFPAQEDDWFDKTLLRVDEAQRVEGEGYVIEKTDSGWALKTSSSPVNDDHLELVFDEDKANELAEVFSNIRVQAWAQNIELKDAIEINVKTENQDLSYAFAKISDEFYVRRGDIDKVFSVRDVDFEKVAQANLQYFFSEEEAALDEGDVAPEKDVLGNFISADDAISSQ